MRVLDAQVCALQGNDDLRERNYTLLNRQVRILVDGGIAASMADRCFCGGASLSVDDIVVDQHGSDAVIVACIFCDDGRLLLKVELMQRVGGSAWATKKQVSMWLARDAYQPVAWRQRGDGSFVLID
jgi:hypothetical protein